MVKSYLPRRGSGLVSPFGLVPEAPHPLARHRQFSEFYPPTLLHIRQPPSPGQPCYPKGWTSGGKPALGRSPAAAVQPAPTAWELNGEAPQTAGFGSRGSRRAHFLQLVGPLGCRRLPARGARSAAPRLAPRLRALPWGRQGRWGRLSCGGESPSSGRPPSSQIQSRVPFPAPCAGVSARVCARASVSGKRVCAGEYAEGAQAAGGAGGGRQGAGEGAGRECVRACNSTPGLCASPGDSIGGGWRRSGRRRVQAHSAAGAGGKPARELSRHEPETPQPSPSGARAEPRSTRSQAARGRQPRRGGRRRGGPPVRCAQRRGAPPTRRGAREPGGWARRRLGGCCSPAPRAAAPGSPPRPRPGHARWRPTMTAPWRRLRSLVWEYWAGLLVCAFWIPDSRGMPHVIRIGKGSPGAGGLCALGWGRELEWGCSERDPRDCPNLPLGCRARMSAGSSWWRGQSSKARVAGLT